MQLNNRTKEIIRNLIRKTLLYKREQKRLLKPFDSRMLEEAVREAIDHVPYYAGYKKILEGGFDIKKIPIIRKKDMLGREKEFVSRKANKFLLSKKETSGSTGASLEIYESIDLTIKKNVIGDYAFSLIGDDMKIGVLRGNAPKNKAMSERINSHQILLSSYQINENTVDDYISIIKENKIECLHVYPSSIYILAKVIKNKYGTSIKFPYLKGILSSSEIFSRQNKRLVKEVFSGVKIVDLYGHNELACAAIAVDDGYFEFYNNYGYVEFLDTGMTTNGHKIAEIIATSIMNKTMPFIRYGTDDFVELDQHGNVLSIIGRPTDFLVNKKKQIVPCTIYIRGCSLLNAEAFQYYQDTEGVLIFRVKANKLYGEREINYLLEDLNRTIVDMDCRVEVVDEMIRTRQGKLTQMVQKLDLSKYK